MEIYTKICWNTKKRLVTGYKPFFHLFVSQHMINFFSCTRSLQFLSIQQFIFKLFDWFAGFNERLAHSSVPATVARCDQISDTATFEECGQFTAWIEDVYEFDHFHQTKTNHCCFCIVAQAETIYEASATCYDILRKKKNYKTQWTSWSDDLSNSEISKEISNSLVITIKLSNHTGRK